ncbi:hypothetical protein V6R21_32340 [Limibacter armeniacum]|uniref:hypothetical protein n=1 Tax=Limibacter armeniacum TaxID=466084 RepID=UPI002FE6950D
MSSSNGIILSIELGFLFMLIALVIFLNIDDAKKLKESKKHHREIRNHIDQEKFKLEIFENNIIKLMKKPKGHTHYYKEVGVFYDMDEAIEAKVNAEFKRDQRDGSGTPTSYY